MAAADLRAYVAPRDGLAREFEAVTGSREEARRKSAVPSVVLGLTLLFCAVLALILGMLIWQGYFATIAQTRAKAESAAHVVSVHAQWLIEAGNQALRRIDDVVGPDPATADIANETIRRELAGLPAEVVRLVLYDAAGNVISGDAGTPTAVGHDEYFTALREGADWQISSLILDEGGSTPRFAVARRLERDGRFAGALAIYYPASVMEDFWSSLALGRQSTVSIVRTDGWLIARFPSPSAPLNLIDYELFTDHYAAAPIGSYIAAQSPADGLPRTVGFRKIAGLPVLALASISSGAAMSEFWRAAGIVVAIVAPLIILLAAGAIWLVGIMRRDERTRFQLARASEDNTILMREIHHRVKNNLQAVSSLVQLQPIPQTAKLEMSRRIAAMVSVHEHIYRSDQFANAQIDAYIRVIVNNALAGAGAPIELSMNLQPLTVDKDHAMPLGLIVSEVVSNAFKHAFGERTDGRIEVSLTRQEDGKGRLTISDNGAGFDASARSEGMGRRLIDGLARQLDGEYRFENDNGTRFVLDFPPAATGNVTGS